MTLTFFLSQVFGWYFLLIGALFLIKRTEFIQSVGEMARSKALLLLAGFFAVTCGLLVVISHNEWNAGALSTLVTLIGWAILVKGIAIIFLPRQVVAVWTRWSNLEKFAYVYATVAIVIGLCLLCGV